MAILQQMEICENSTSGQRTETLLAEVDCYDMFGTRYPWIEDMKVAEDGSVMVLMTQDRDDDSASELMVFRLTGF